MSGISILVEYRVKHGMRDEFLRVLAENCEDTLADDGCFRMEVSEPFDGDGLSFSLSELWRDEASIQKHRQKPGHDEGHERLDKLVDAKRVVKGRVL